MIWLVCEGAIAPSIGHWCTFTGKLDFMGDMKAVACTNYVLHCHFVKNMFGSWPYILVALVRNCRSHAEQMDKEMTSNFTNNLQHKFVGPERS